jgi:SAM-dependent methyltransferase
MQYDRTNWNQKYARGSYPTTPSRIVKDYYHLAPAGRALDIAAGSGRNALFLATQGFTVDAVDISEVGLRLFAGRHRRINPVCIDLDILDISADRYSLIVNTKYLSRRLFPYIYEGLVHGGLLIFETYTKSKDFHPQRPFRDDHLLRSNELLHAFLRLKILFYMESSIPGPNDPYPLTSLVAVKK